MPTTKPSSPSALQASPPRELQGSSSSSEDGSGASCSASQNPPQGLPSRNKPLLRSQVSKIDDSVHAMLHSARSAEEPSLDRLERSRVANIKKLVQRATFDRHGRSRNLLAGCELGPSPPEFVSGTDLSNEVLEDLLQLTRANMKAMYDSSTGWSWSDVSKRGELRNERMRWLLVWADAAKSRVAGFAAFRLAADSGVAHIYLHELQIAADFRQHGLGEWRVCVHVCAQAPHVLMRCARAPQAPG
jgi:hypothetical protein